LAPPGVRPAGLLAVCANPACQSGWLRWWRGRQTPVFEGGWACGERCLRALLRAAVLRELEGLEPPPAAHRHRVPLGLLLLAQGAITREQLRAALERQRRLGGRIGRWLVREQGIDEREITRALGTQWGAPVLAAGSHSPEKVAGVAPRLFVDAFGFLPLRVAGGAVLYIGFEDRIDRCVCLALERMTGLRVEAGLVDGRAFDAAHRRMLGTGFPPARMVEASAVDALVAALARIVEEARPVEARLVRMRDYLWLRLWKRRPGARRAVAGQPMLAQTRQLLPRVALEELLDDSYSGSAGRVADQPGPAQSGVSERGGWIEGSFEDVIGSLNDGRA
jgi:hypothetical protein